MSEQSLISVIKTYIRASGPVTCTQIASAINAAPQDVISVIREAVERGSLAEKNGYYDICRQPSESRRSSYSWVEGNTLPAWVMRLARGPKTCESVDVVAEVDRAKRAQGWPPFILASIDVRLSHFKCVSTGEIVDRHILRYLPLDTTEVIVL
ncbi:hypothetical protein [Citrobacter koseri]|uniref:hypothetical protein n=1 Tax=Citrobacter koseri TaxID=545 RepID=UPI002E312510|nr:hypothetical protein [Citrobacter koseri]